MTKVKGKGEALLQQIESNMHKLDEEQLRQLRKAITKRIEMFEDEKIDDLKSQLKVGSRVQLVSGVKKAERLGLSKGIVKAIKNTRAIVELNGTEYRVPLGLLKAI